MYRCKYRQIGDDIYMKMANIAFCCYNIVESLYGAHTIMTQCMAGRVIK